MKHALSRRVKYVLVVLQQAPLRFFTGTKKEMRWFWKKFRVGGYNEERILSQQGFPPLRDKRIFFGHTLRAFSYKFWPGFRWWFYFSSTGLFKIKRYSHGIRRNGL